MLLHETPLELLRQSGWLPFRPKSTARRRAVIKAAAFSVTEEIKTGIRSAPAETTPLKQADFFNLKGMSELIEYNGSSGKRF